MTLSTFSLSNFSTFDYVVLSINLLLFLFSRPLVQGFKRSDSKSVSSKLYALRAINIILFFLYIAALFVEGWSKQISLTGLTFLLAFIFSHLLHIFIIKKFGRGREIDGVDYHTETYQSEVFSLLITLITVIASIVIVINIWGMNDWLKATSVLGVLAILVFSTKDVWIPDNISGLILLYNSDIESGAVVKIDDQNLLAIVVQTSLTRTTFRDLKTRHHIVLPNTLIRNSKIEILSKGPASGLMQFVHFNIAYGIPASKVENLLRNIWEKACEASSAINAEREPEISVVDTGDHAVNWRLGYKLKNLYQMLDVECMVKRIAYELAEAQKIELQTPLTHNIDLDNRLSSTLDPA
jgi:small-conductance mechanosensitive channel